MLRSNQGMAYYRDQNNTIFKLLEARKIEVSFTIEIHDYVQLGTLTTQHYPGAVNITGNMELYMCSSFFIDKMNIYRRTGTPFYFNLMISNGNIQENQTLPMNQQVGHQTVLLKNVLLSQVPIASLGLDTEGVAGTYNFVANDFELQNAFNEQVIHQP